MSNVHLTGFRRGFPYGCTDIIDLREIANKVGMGFTILRLDLGAEGSPLGFYAQENGIEAQLIVLSGAGIITVGERSYEVKRKDVFSENPWAFDIPPGMFYSVRPRDKIEVAIIRTANSHRFRPVVVRPRDIISEQRGEGLVDGTMHRIVKAIFGDPRCPKRARLRKSNLVVGEVINFPGRWSSYPPHYHLQDEVYYYRFDRPQGFGGCFLDEDAYVVHTHDAVKIMNCVGHAQVSAPGYAMWYLWCIRQIEGNRYEGDPPFKYFPEHEWVLDPTEKIWRPQ